MILGSLLRQCLTVDTLSKNTERALLELLSDNLSDAEGLEDLFRVVLDGSISTHYLVIDGLDKVSRSGRAVVLTMLRKTSSFEIAEVQIFLASRQDIGREINATFGSCQRRMTRCAELYSDTASYVELGLEQKHINGDLIIGGSDLILVIKDSLFRGVSGMSVVFEVTRALIGTDNTHVPLGLLSD